MHIATLSLLLALAAAPAEDPFAALVRPTDPLTPEEELKSFELPPGFEIQLVASEPEILKPMNLAFDERGRLWVTDTTEYPFPAPPDRKARDSIKVLEDSDGDGRADKVTTFAEGLNIPIGIYPYKGGAIAYSIPNIWRFEDSDGDGRADRQEKLYGPMGWERDTHGMNNAFRRGFDGWLYACHGFNNETSVAGTDGHAIKMQSGNSYRMRVDGSRVEQFTWGQVNPFGMCFDPLGNIYTCDCHTRPITALLRGGHYESFGKPDDGLGFVPEVMQHIHGSTGNGGIVFSTGDDFPPEFRGNVYTGNVVTSRVNRDRLVYRGSTVEAKEEPDLVVTKDPWFRPVDLREGPDGSLYIADFYNKIIGHYEVPLKHPGRDRHRGRIWRVVYRGSREEARPVKKPPSLAGASAAELIAALADASLTRRMMAADQLADRIGKAAAAPVREAFRSAPGGAGRSHCLWVLHRLGSIEERDLETAARDPDHSLRVHAMRVLAETADWSEAVRALAVAGLGDPEAFVARAAADALGQHPRFENVRPLLDLCRKAPAEDVHLLHAARIALRDQLREPAVLQRVAELPLDETDSRRIAGVALAVASPGAGAFLVKHLKTVPRGNESTARLLRHAARHAPESELDSLAGLARERFEPDPDLQLDLLLSIQDGLDQRGSPPRPSIVEWGASLARSLLDSVDPGSISWRNMPIEGKPSENPWVLEPRRWSSSRDDDPFLGSLPKGEHLTGALRSRPFTIPSRLSFWIAGHDGFPDKPPSGRNKVRLRAADSDAVLKEAPAPRNDAAQRVEWDLETHAGKKGYLEAVDADDGGAYAWLAVGRFEPRVVEIPRLDPSRMADRVRAAATLVSRLKLAPLKPRLAEILTAGAMEPGAAASLAAALIALEPSSEAAAMAAVLGDAAVTAGLRQRIAASIARRDGEAAREVLKEAFRSVPARLQLEVARALAQDAAGAETLLGLVKQADASPRLLLRNSVKERLLASRPARVQERIEELTANLPTENEAILKLMEARRNGFAGHSASMDKGAEVYLKSCGACHQLGSKGKVLGPQLDGIGSRGLERLLEDVLDPNRNVDIAFRTTTLVMKDGAVLTGLLRREEGETLVLADSKGDELKVAKKDTVQQTRTELSLMPENLGEAMPEEEFYDLLGFLLASRSPPSGPGAADAAITTIAGTGRGDLGLFRGKALEVDINQPFGVEVGPDGALYICEIGHHRVLRLDPKTGEATTVAGNGMQGRAGDGGPALSASLNEPYEVRFDGEGNMYFVEMVGALVRKVDARTRVISSVAGNGTPGFSGDGGPAVKAQLRDPHSIALDGKDGLYIADIGNHRIRRVDLKGGMIDTVAGNGAKELPRDGSVATGQPLLGPRALFVTGGAMWIALREGHSVWKMDLASRRLTHIAGDGKAGWKDGAAKEALFNGPKGIAVGPRGDLFVADTENQAIRRIDGKTGEVSTVAGSGPAGRGYSGDGGPAREARMDRPHGIAVDAQGTLYIGDSNNHRVRRVGP